LQVLACRIRSCGKPWSRTLDRSGAQLARARDIRADHQQPLHLAEVLRLDAAGATIATSGARSETIWTRPSSKRSPSRTARLANRPCLITQIEPALP